MFCFLLLFEQGRNISPALFVLVYTFGYILMNFLELLKAQESRYNKSKKSERSDKNEQTYFR